LLPPVISTAASDASKATASRDAVRHAMRDVRIVTRATAEPVRGSASHVQIQRAASIFALTLLICFMRMAAFIF
jgi:hypothetical protein